MYILDSINEPILDNRGYPIESTYECYSRRIAFRDYLKNKTGVENLYFQPPESIKMQYPAIVYSISRVDNKFAENKNYLQFIAYQVIVIDKNPDSDIFKKMSRLLMCTFDRLYTADNLNHFVFTIYY